MEGVRNEVKTDKCKGYERNMGQKLEEDKGMKG
jgi:hypothetical protein